MSPASNTPEAHGRTKKLNVQSNSDDILDRNDSAALIQRMPENDQFYLLQSQPNMHARSYSANGSSASPSKRLQAIPQQSKQIMLTVQNRAAEMDEARRTVENLANEFRMLIGAQPQRTTQPQHRSVRLGDYLRERELSAKRNPRKVQLLPEPDQSMIFRKKRDEVLKLIERVTKFLEEMRSTIIEHTDLKTLISNENKLRELAETANYCRVAFRSSSNVVNEKEPVSVAITPQQEEQIKTAIESLKPQAPPAPPANDTIKVTAPPRDINELKSIVNFGLKQHSNERSTTNLRNKLPTKQSIANKTDSANNQQDEIYESKVLLNPNGAVVMTGLTVPTAAQAGGLKPARRRTSFAENSMFRSRAPTALELKQSLYQPDDAPELEKSSSQARFGVQHQLKKSLTINIKDSNFHLAKGEVK